MNADANSDEVQFALVCGDLCGAGPDRAVARLVPAYLPADRKDLAVSRLPRNCSNPSVSTGSGRGTGQCDVFPIGTGPFPQFAELLGII